jgi:hypothetical protein
VQASKPRCAPRGHGAELARHGRHQQPAQAQQRDLRHARLPARWPARPAGAQAFTFLPQPELIIACGMACRESHRPGGTHRHAAGGKRERSGSAAQALMPRDPSCRPPHHRYGTVIWPVSSRMGLGAWRCEQWRVALGFAALVQQARVRVHTALAARRPIALPILGSNSQTLQPLQCGESQVMAVCVAVNAGKGLAPGMPPPGTPPAAPRAA